MRKRFLLLPMVAALTGIALPVPASALVGGTRVTEPQPFMVSLQSSSGSHTCAGALIKANWVVTAKHCGTPAQVRIGSLSRTSGGTVARVSRTIWHPSADLELLQLATTVTHTPIPIAAESGPVDTPVAMMGWGRTCSTVPCDQPVQLQQLSSTIVDDSRCSGGLRLSSEICVDNKNNTGPCAGDSGNPLTKNVAGAQQLIGVFSRSGGSNPVCGADPSRHVDLPDDRTWIIQNTGG
nr:serine protease [Kibdelosporangium sp. MJ126-NF4]CEL14625.1 secreted trypsin-like serine protease [Kibdelosporangium sp. MJ126-NF4]CTQ96746.1 secreted trypsin-like serine protease [Kibdelosporangium sp. MJ126-NF4]